MPDPNSIAYATELLRTRPDLSLEDPVAAFIGHDPSAERLTEVALALARPTVLLPYVDALLHDPSGTTFAESPATTLVAERDGKCVDSLHALTLAKGEEWDARMHVWMRGGQFIDDPHTHRSAFGSAVITGAFCDEIFTCTEPVQGDKRMVEWRSDLSDPLGEIALHSLGKRVFTIGQHHTMPHTVIHSAQIDSTRLSATVVVRRVRSDVSFAYTDGPPSTSAPRLELIDGLDTLRCVRKVLRDM